MIAFPVAFLIYPLKYPSAIPDVSSRTSLSKLFSSSNISLLFYQTLLHLKSSFPFNFQYYPFGRHFRDFQSQFICLIPCLVFTFIHPTRYNNLVLMETVIKNNGFLWFQYGSPPSSDSEWTWFTSVLHYKKVEFSWRLFASYSREFDTQR